MGKYEVTVTFSIKMDMDSEESARDEAEAVVNKVCGYYDPFGQWDSYVEVEDAD